MQTTSANSIECVCQKCEELHKEYLQTLWTIYRRDNRKDARKHLNDVEYKIKIAKEMIHILNMKM